MQMIEIAAALISALIAVVFALWRQARKHQPHVWRVEKMSQSKVDEFTAALEKARGQHILIGSGVECVGPVGAPMAAALNPAESYREWARTQDGLTVGPNVEFISEAEYTRRLDQGAYRLDRDERGTSSSGPK
jgi:hypothetical protein